MTPILQLLLVLACLIAVAKVAGYLSQQIGQPAVLGELLAGVILGPTVIGILQLPLFTPEAHLEETVAYLAEIGVIFLMFIAGMEIDLETMRESGLVSVLAGILGVIVPLVFGAGLSLAGGYTLIPALYIGIILTATSVSISAQTLLELGRLRTREGVALLGAAVVDDVLAIIILSVFLAFAADGAGGGPLSIIWIIVRMTLYLIGALVVGRYLLRPLMVRIAEWPVSEGLVSAAIVIVLLYSWSAEVVGGIAQITGAFIAGAFLGQSSFREEIEHGMHTVAYGFFVPIFFINIGLLTNARALAVSDLPFVLGLTAIAIITKVIGSGGGAFFGGFERDRAFRVGVGMISRGEVGLIVASLGIRNAIIEQSVFSITVVIVLITTLVTPIFLRWVYDREEQPSVETAVSV